MKGAVVIHAKCGTMPGCYLRICEDIEGPPSVGDVFTAVASTRAGVPTIPGEKPRQWLVTAIKGEPRYQMFVLEAW